MPWSILDWHNKGKKKRIYFKEMAKKITCSSISIFLSALLLCSCASLVQKSSLPEESAQFELVPEEEWPLLVDDLDQKSLEFAVAESLGYLEKRPLNKKFWLGTREISNEEIFSTLSLFLKILQNNPPGNPLQDQIRTHFHLYRVALSPKTSPLLITGYYEPLLSGSRVPSPRFKYPIYRLPDDLLFIDPKKFSKNFQGQKWIGRTEGNRVVPYFTRQEIDREGRLAGKNLEILWVDDPIKLFFLHIQGSGEILLEDGSLIKLGYKGTNGHPYFAIGKELIRRGIFQPEAVSLQSIHSYLQANPQDQEGLMNLNPSYVFFRETVGGPYGNLGLPLTPGRSIAADQRIFPAAGLGWLVGEKPSFDDKGHLLSWNPFGRWVSIQDSGGAIKGPSRVDLFWGSGQEAELAAGHLRHQGSLFFLLKK